MQSSCYFTSLKIRVENCSDGNECECLHSLAVSSVSMCVCVETPAERAWLHHTQGGLSSQLCSLVLVHLYMVMWAKAFN